jgi:L-threonylcarbamoyladenylate synthase
LNKVDIILDGGPSFIGVESTVVDLVGKGPVLLRPGGTPLEAIKQVVPGIKVKPEYLRIEETESASKSPGMLTKHYSPKAKVIMVAGEKPEAVSLMKKLAGEYSGDNKLVGILSTSEDAPEFSDLPVRLLTLGSESDLEQIAFSLFSKMRELDKQDVDIILVRELSREGLGLAIWDRLLRASDGQVIDASNEGFL